MTGQEIACCQIAFDFFLRPSSLLPGNLSEVVLLAAAAPGTFICGTLGLFLRVLLCPLAVTQPVQSCTWRCCPVLQVNIIPIIAKADTIAKNELHKFKSKIMSELVSNGVQIYQFPTDEETVAEINATMSVCYLGGCCPCFAWACP